MLIHDGLHRVPRGLLATTTCGGGWGILAHRWRSLILRGRIISAHVLLVRRRDPRTIGCSVWSVVRPAARDMLYRVLPRVLQPDALVVAVVRRVVDWWREDWCSLVR